MPKECDEVAPNALDEPAEAWNQLSMLAPEMIRVELVCHVEGPSEKWSVGYRVQHGLNRDLVAMEVWHGSELATVLAAALDMLDTALSSALIGLSPF